MEAVKPDINGFPEMLCGATQEEYNTLPATLAYDADGNFILVTRWKLSPDERAAVAAGGDVYLTVLTFGQPLQPVMLGTEPPEMHRTAPQIFAVPKAGGIH